MLGLSHFSIYEALQELTAMGLMEIHRSDGTFIKELHPNINLTANCGVSTNELQKEMRQHVNQARLVLEIGIGRIVCQTSNEESRMKLCPAL